MARHYTKKETGFELRLLTSEKASAHGGQLAVEALFGEFGLWAKVRQLRALDKRKHLGKGYDPVVYVAQVLFCLCSGGRCGAFG